MTLKRSLVRLRDKFGNISDPPSYRTGGHMRGKIACSADRLSLLEASMISSVVEPNAFQIGRQYHAEHRVRIADASDTQLTSAVMGNSGLYEQTIRLHEGFLEARCSCTLSEQPLCRHGVASLLEYQQWHRARAASRVKPLHPQPESDRRTPVSRPSTDVKLGELTQFMEWMQRTVQAMERDHPLPPAPDFGGSEVAAWVEVIRNMDARRRDSEVVQMGLEADLRNRDAAVARMTQELEASVEEAKSLQASCRELQHELDLQRAAIAKTTGLSRQVEQFDSEIKAIAGILAEKCARLETLAGTSREVTAMLKSLDKV